jgi:hypothetical protein
MSLSKYLSSIYIYIYKCSLSDYTGCSKMTFTMVFRMLLCGECYENVYTLRRTNYAPLNTTQPLTELSTRSRELMLMGIKSQPVHRAHNITAIC